MVLNGGLWTVPSDMKQYWPIVLIAVLAARSNQGEYLLFISTHKVKTQYLQI